MLSQMFTFLHLCTMQKLFNKSYNQVLNNSRISLVVEAAQNKFLNAKEYRHMSKFSFVRDKYCNTLLTCIQLRYQKLIFVYLQLLRIVYKHKTHSKL